MPIYDWSYKTVWRFIIECDLSYCSLYNYGYTYIGDRSNSIPNPFINNNHSLHGNDNIELFSRTKLY